MSKIPRPPENFPARTYAVANWLFLRLLACCYFFAFASLAGQLPGLVGSGGILPAQEYVSGVAAWADASDIGLDRYRLVPSVAWISAGTDFLVGLAMAGSVMSALVIAGFAPALLLPLLWVSWLSLAAITGDFLGYQWDALLLECGLLACFAAPLRWRDRLPGTDPPPLARWLLWWLLFRLMFGSGVVKLASGDIAWRNLTALAFHYETQPLPTPIAWYAAQLPVWFHQISTAAVHVIELAAPWLVFAGVRARPLAAALFVGLQALIALTGNYAYFNLLTAALCVMLLDDGVFRRAVRVAPLPAGWSARTVPAALAAVIVVPVSATTLGAQLGFARPSWVEPLRAAIAPFRSVNAYGLFAVMTQTRPEIVVEGSNDGVRWLPYEFRHKPGRLDRAPTWVAPFQPRLDWQMWFAALGRYEEEVWFQRFCRRLLEGSPDVVALLARNPFPDAPPRYLRARLYVYKFTRRGASSPDAWWTREYVREYLPVVSFSFPEKKEERSKK